MSFKFKMESYPVASPSKLLATDGGAHILNGVATVDLWNGAIVVDDGYKSFDQHEMSPATTTADGDVVLKAKVVDIEANGNYLVEVTEAKGVFLVYNAPVVEAEYTTEMKQASHYYVAADEEFRAHQLCAYDQFELSADGFSGTVEVNKEITTVSGGKPVIA